MHEAFLYGSEEQFQRVVGEFISTGVTAGTPVLVALPAERLGPLRRQVGGAGAAEGVRWLDIRRAGANPGRLLPDALGFAAEHPGPVRLVGEPAFAGRRPSELAAVAEHEALVNLAFAGQAVHAMCPYDSRALDEAVLRDARESHPHVRVADGVCRNEGYDPQRVLHRARWLLDPPAPEQVWSYAVRDRADLIGVRRFAAGAARLLGQSAGTIERLEFAVTELASNSLHHARTPATVQLWHHDGGIVCTVTDEGRLDDPLAGHRPAAPDRSTGRGLVRLQRLADLVRIVANETGTAVQVTLRDDG